MNILTLAPTFPSAADPNFGVFVKERVKALSRMKGVEVRVIAPVPWSPPIKISENWARWNNFPKQEIIDGLHVTRPRYALPPKLGGYFHSNLMFPAAKEAAKKIQKDFPFDIIDSHFVYPGGAVALKLSNTFDVPFVITGRGEDVLRFPSLPLIGKQIKDAIQNCHQCIGVSREIADTMDSLVRVRERPTVIENGIDNSKFYPADKTICRKTLNLPLDRRIILSVGERIPRKGFALLIKAMPKILEAHPSAVLFILGRTGRYGRDTTTYLHSEITRLDLEDFVKIMPPCSHGDLRNWYSASDVFALMSQSEGCPNVLLEALACGTPCVSTNVGSVQDDLKSKQQGIILENRSPKSASDAISHILNQEWDSKSISDSMRYRTWEDVAKKCHATLERAICLHKKRQL